MAASWSNVLCYFRLADALPVGVIKKLEYQRRVWLQARRISSDEPVQTAFDRLSQSDRLLYRKFVGRIRDEATDQGLGKCWLKRADVVQLIREQLFRFDGDRYDLGDTVLMLNHVHPLIAPREVELERCLRGIKGASAKYSNDLLERSGTFWQADSYDHIVRSFKQLAVYRN